MDEEIFSIDACAACVGASFADALAAAREAKFDYLIYEGKIYEVLTGTEAVHVI